jgi:hypothetical protein
MRLCMTGTWNGKMVAVKVLEYSQQQNDDGCLLEGLLSEQVQHPHVVSAEAGSALQQPTSSLARMLTSSSQGSSNVCCFQLCFA